MSREFAFIEMEDDPDVAYVVSIPETSSERYADIVMERFGEMFDDSDITVVSGDIAAGDSLKVQQVDTETFKEEYMEVEDDD